jgi:predicted transposase YbfD/YdcC
MCQKKTGEIKYILIFQVNETELINYVRDAFHMDEEKHQQLLEIATMKEVSNNRL